MGTQQANQHAGEKEATATDQGQPEKERLHDQDHRQGPRGQER